VEAGHIRWSGWPPYEQTLIHYRWADVFAFTSLRDTSGTGLLESLAMGAPIVGMDHQGARDVMTDDCAIRIPVESPRETIHSFRSAFTRLARHQELHHRLSCGALERARDFYWDRHGERMAMVYRRVLKVDDSALTNVSLREEANCEAARVPATGAV
jgi:glycosyltransferase involved in cell wall biosynthesis